MYWEGSQDSVLISHRTQTHGLLQQMVIKQTQQSEKTHVVNSGENQAQAPKSPLPVESHRMPLIPLASDCDTGLTGKFISISVSKVFTGVSSA